MSSPELERDNSSRKLCEDNSTEHDQEQERRPTSCIAYRWVTTVMLSFGMIIIHAQRVNVAVTLLAVYDDNLGAKVGSDQARRNLPTTAWSMLQISVLHSMFFVGYTLTQIPAGILCYKVPSHRVFGIACLLSCLLNVFLPVAIDHNQYTVTMIIRILQGLAEGFVWPAAFVLVANWSTGQERNNLSGCVATGSFAGAILGFLLSGVVTHYYSWKYIYYATGALGLVWWILWVVFVYEKAEHNPKVSQKELRLIMENKSQHPVKTSDFPWRAVLTSAPFIALCSCGFAKGWVFNLLLMQEPIYMHVFGYSVIQNGAASALPFLLKMIVCLFSGFLADVLINKTFLNRTQIRKVFNTLGLGVEALCLFSLSFIYKSSLALIVLSLGVMMGGFSISGWQTNHLDLAPHYAGILVAISQCFTNLAGIFSPITAGAFVSQSSKLADALKNAAFKVDDIDIYGWHMVFLVCSLINMVCSVVYILFASGEEQNWSIVIPDLDNHESTIPLSTNKNTVSYQTLPESMDTITALPLTPSQETLEADQSETNVDK